MPLSELGEPRSMIKIIVVNSCSFVVHKLVAPTIFSVVRFQSWFHITDVGPASFSVVRKLSCISTFFSYHKFPEKTPHNIRYCTSTLISEAQYLPWRSLNVPEENEITITKFEFYVQTIIIKNTFEQRQWTFGLATASYAGGHRFKSHRKEQKFLRF